MTETFILAMLLGSFSGIAAGLFGLGGGLVLVPMLAWLFCLQHFPAQLVMVMAVATSLATIIPTALVSMYSHHCRGVVNWDKAVKLIPGIVLGAGVGAWLADFADGALLRGLFIAYLLYVAVTMIGGVSPVIRLTTRPAWLEFGAGSVIGAMSSLLGIGGGTLTVPFLLGQRLEMIQAVAVSSVCGLPIALVATVSYVVLGWKQAGLPAGSIGYIYFPAFVGIMIMSTLTAPIGVKLAHRLPAKELKRYFAVVLLMMAMKMMV